MWETAAANHQNPSCAASSQCAGAQPLRIAPSLAGSHCSLTKWHYYKDGENERVRCMATAKACGETKSRMITHHKRLAVAILCVRSSRDHL